MTDKDDIYYINLVRNGDVAAFSYLVEYYQDMVYSLALKILKDSGEAEDLAQEVFLSVYKSLDHFKGNSKFSTWLYRITYNKAISKIRKGKKETFTEDDIFLENKLEAEFQQTGLSDDEENLLYLRKAIRKLSDEEQLIVMLHYFQDQSIEEISKVTSFSASNVKVKLFRARKKLKDLVEGSKPIIPVIR